MKTDESILIKICILLYAVILAIFIGRVLFFTDVPDFCNSVGEEASHDYSAGWITESGEIVDLKDITAGGMGGSYSVSKVLPVKTLETEADNKMYEEKRNFYRGGNDRRASEKRM